MNLLVNYIHGVVIDRIETFLTKGDVFVSNALAHAHGGVDKQGLIQQNVRARGV